MLATKTPSPLRIGRAQFQCLRSFSSTATARKLQLAYDHYPASESTATKNAPIVFIHGLFGSKKNNRSMSKYVFIPLPLLDDQSNAPTESSLAT